MDFDNRLVVERWLAELPRELIAAFAARAALRTVPEFVSLLHKSRKARDILRKQAIVPALRAISTAWLQSEDPDKRLIPVAEVAASTAFRSGENMSGKGMRAVLAAASAASECASSLTVHGAAAYGATAIYASVRLSRDCASAVGRDAEDYHAEPGKLTHQPLWPSGVPGWANEGWLKLKKSLLGTNEDWDVWTDWYEARLQGGVVDSDLEWQRVTLPEDLWEESPALLNAEIKRIIENLASSRRLQPLENVPSPVTFDLSQVGTIIIASNPANLPVFARDASPEDHGRLIDTARSLAQDLIKDLRAQKYQARIDYSECLQKYDERLPLRPGSGNILLADAEARTLRNLFAGEAQILDVSFAAKLKTFLEQHIGLRPFYPEIASFYRHVQTGHLERPLPLDALDGVINSVKEYSPGVFDPSVSHAIEGTKREAPNPALLHEDDFPPQNRNQPTPPNDPLGEIDSKKAREFSAAGVVNSLWKAFVQGEKVYKAIEGWSKADEAIRPYVSEILTWLHSYLDNGGGMPPAPPTIGV